jgi:hypothetical protein
MLIKKYCEACFKTLGAIKGKEFKWDEDSARFSCHTYGDLRIYNEPPEKCPYKDDHEEDSEKYKVDRSHIRRCNED